MNDERWGGWRSPKRLVKNDVGVIQRGIKVVSPGFPTQRHPEKMYRPSTIFHHRLLWITSFVINIYARSEYITYICALMTFWLPYTIIIYIRVSRPIYPVSIWLVVFPPAQQFIMGTNYLFFIFTNATQMIKIV